MNNKLLNKICHTLRGRLALWYIATILFLLFFFTVAAGSVFLVAFRSQIDHHIHIAVNEAGQIVENYQGEERDLLIKNLVSAKGMTVVVLSPDSAPILETNSPDVALVTEHTLQKILTSTGLYESAPIHFTANNIRFAAKPVKISAGKGIVAVGYSTQIIYVTFYKILLMLSGIIIFAVLPATVIGVRLLKKQLRPLEDIANQAKAVSSLTSLSKRIQVPSTTEELETIQTALNFMLSQLEKIFKREREFFSDAAHTLKTPLSVLRYQIENSTLDQNYKKDMLLTIDTTNETIQDLLFLSKIGKREEDTTTFSLSKLMADLSELAATLGENKNLHISEEIEKNVDIKADRQLFLRALSNIVYNAVLYNKDGGSIKLYLKRESGRIIIKVADSGAGIKKEEQTHVFTRFFRGSKATGKGSGLGLSISKAVVENYDGRISLESSINKGTTVTIVF